MDAFSACVCSCKEWWSHLFALSDLAFEGFMRVQSGAVALLRACSRLRVLPCCFADAWWAPFEDENMDFWRDLWGRRGPAITDGFGHASGDWDETKNSFSDAQNPETTKPYIYMYIYIYICILFLYIILFFFARQSRVPATALLAWTRLNRPRKAKGNQTEPKPSQNESKNCQRHPLRKRLAKIW